MPATQLSLYNNALQKLGETALVSTSETREARFLLDNVYSQARLEMLEKGIWKFAIRSVEIVADTAIEPDFGYVDAFTKPEDWVRTYQVSASEFFDPPLEDFIEEAGMWFATCGTLYVRYVSNDADYGLDMSRWTYLFVSAFEWELASKVCIGVTQGRADKADIEKGAEKALSKALQLEAQREPAKQVPAGRLVQARFGRGYRYDPRVTR